MTRKHYKAIAEIIKDAQQIDGGVDPIAFIRDKLSDYFAAENDLFDCTRFTAACNPEISS